ncbi:MAG TPA: hypothetical protein VIM01_14665 [Dermatophilaceae bacterium]|jgi:predicted enzyme related to lactoylglutathione lyase
MASRRQQWRRSPGRAHQLWHVEDIKDCLAHLLADGATERQAVSDVGGGKMLASVTDADGNVIGLIQEA